MYIPKSTRLLVTALVLAIGLTPAIAFSRGGTSGGSGSSGSRSGGTGGGGGGGFHGGGGGGGGGASHVSSGGTSHISTGGSSVHTGSVGSAGTRVLSGSGGISSGKVGSVGSGVGGATTRMHTGGTTSTGSTATLHTGVGSHTPTFSHSGPATLHTGGATTHIGTTGVGTTHVNIGPGTNIGKNTGPHVNIGPGTTSHVNIGPGTNVGKNTNIGKGTGTPHINIGPGTTTHVNIGPGTRIGTTGGSHINIGPGTVHSGMHTGATFKHGFTPGTHLNPGFHNPGFAHNPAMHINNLGVAHFGNHNLHLAGLNYHPSYFNHSFYHGPWSGLGWGWGWGLSPGLGFGFGWGGGGWGPGWGYGGWGYGGYGGWGPYSYWGRPLGWGCGAWGLGSMVYTCGYNPYYNPYYIVPVGTTVVYDYTNPIPVDTGTTVAAIDTPVPPDQPIDPNQPDPAPVADNPEFDVARAAFSQGDYNAALSSIDAAIAKVPTDAVLHEFRALVLFALQDFRQSAGVIHSVLAVGPGWDWTTMSSLYSDPGLYAQQLRALEDFTQANPKAAEAHFLLAYHYMVCSHKEASANQLQQVVQLQPNDRLAGELLKMVQGPPQQPTTTAETTTDPSVVAQPPVTPADNQPEPPAIDKDLLPGAWSASRPDGSKFSLKLSDDGKFTWKFSAPKQKGDEFSGTYTIDGPVLMLQRESGGALAGVATFDGNSRFNFKMVGGPPEDKGLDFGK